MALDAAGARRQPSDFGKNAMCAALEMTEIEFVAGYRNGAISPPDTVLAGEPRWSVSTLAKELQKQQASQGIHTVICALEALARAERAEGWR